MKPLPGERALYRRLFEASPHPYLILRAEPTFTIVAANDSYLQATGTRRAALVGHRLFEVFPDNPSDPSGTAVADLRDSLIRVLHDRHADVMGVQQYDIPLRDGSGAFELRYWSPVNTPVFDAVGNIAYIIHHVEDVTEFVRGERTHRESAEQLGKIEAHAERMEAEVMRRAAEVKEANRALKAALHELEEREAELARLNERLTQLDRVKTEFFANVSHELRTPLTLILNPVARHLADANLDTGLRRDLEVVERNARLLYRHVIDLLDVAKLEAGRMSLEVEPTDLAHLVRGIAANFEALARMRGIALEVECPASLPAVVDVEKVQRIALNLLANAFKFVPDWGAVRVTLQAADDEATMLVCDTGPGVRPDEREAIFEPFRQANGSATRRFGGTGLGLAIVRQFAELHGGDVVVGDAPGGGAQFTVRIPLSAPLTARAAAGEHHALDPQLNRQALEELQPVAAPADQARDKGGAPLLLIIDDNADMRAYLADTLGRHYRIATATNGREGLERARALHPDLVLADVMMPGMSGEDMVIELRAQAELADMPVLMLTAKADDALMIRLMHAGVQDYLTKPFEPHQLLARVSGLLVQRGRARRRLQESEFRFEAVFEQAAVGMALLTSEGRWLRVNDKVCHIVGYDATELSARSLQDITRAEDVDRNREQMLRIIAHEIDSYSIEKCLVRKDGGLVWVNLTVARAHTPAGTPEYFIAVVEDIQARRQTEQMLRQLRSEMDEMLALHVASQTAAAFAHELNQPLNAVVAYSAAAARMVAAGNPKPERLSQTLESTVRQARRAGEVMRELFRFLQKGDSQLESLDLNDVVRRALSIVEANGCGAVHAELELAPELHRVRANRLQVEKVLVNLVRNGVEAMRGAGIATQSVTVTIITAAWGDLARVTVRDSGPGISGEAARHIFEPFFTTKKKGIGMGLAISRTLIEANGGKLWLDLASGPGACFHFTLPFETETCDSGDAAT